MLGSASRPEQKDLDAVAVVTADAVSQQMNTKQQHHDDLVDDAP